MRWEPPPALPTSSWLNQKRRFILLALSCWVSTASTDSDCCREASLTGDPHCVGAHGDRFDVRGDHNGIYCLLSDNEMTLNARFEQQLFRTPHSKMDVNGSFVRAAFLTLWTLS